MKLGESLAEIVNDPKIETVIDSGKGGVGKSTLTSIISTGLAHSGFNTLVLDTDPAHSMLDAFGQGHGAELEGQTKLIEIRRKLKAHIRLLLTHDIVPEIFQDDEGHTELNRLMDRMLKEEGLLPLLRLAIHPTFMGLSLPYGDFSRVLQLVEVMVAQAYYEIDTTRQGEESLEYKPVGQKPDKVVIDAENTQGFIKTVQGLKYLRRTIENMLERREGTMFSVKNAGFRLMMADQPNIAAVVKSGIISNAGQYGKMLVEAQERLMDRTKTAVIITTQPGWNDLQQTIRELKSLELRGITPAAVVLNKCAGSKHADKWAEAYDQLGYPETALIRVESEFEEVDPLDDLLNIQAIIDANTALVAEELGWRDVPVS